MTVLFVAALVLNVGLGLTLGLSRSMESDAHYFLQAAQSLAAGQGFKIQDTFWPDAPAMSRSPGWPFVVSLALRLAPASSPDLIMRCLALVLNSLVAVLVFLLTRRLFGRPWVAFLAGIGYALHPVALYLAYDGDSEPLFVLLLVGGVLLLLGDRDEAADSVRCPEDRGARGPPSPRLRRADEGQGSEDVTDQSCRGRACADRFGQEGLHERSPYISLMSEALPEVRAQVSGFLLLGLACLVRPNFLPWIAFFVLLLVLRKGLAATNPLTSILSLKGRGRRLGITDDRPTVSVPSDRQSSGFPPLLREPPSPKAMASHGRGRERGCPTELHLSSRWHSVPCLILAVLLFLLPSFFWAVRNYQVSGHFPVLSSLRGQTLYGGNNAVVAHEFKYWGYWVFPNAIPGEKPMAELAGTLTEYEVDDYYYSKGKRYIRKNLRAMPGLLAGKLIRAYVPVPWTVTWRSGAVSVFRWCLSIVAAVGIWRLWGRADDLYKLVLGAMLLTNVTTVLVFWGCARFAFPLDPFFLPFAAAAAGGLGNMAQRAWGRAVVELPSCHVVELM